MGGMIIWNFMSVGILVALLLLWKLEFLATILNLKAFPATVPNELKGVMNEDRRDKAQNYLRVNAKANVVQSITSLTILLAFWLSGGFEWLDTLCRAHTPNELSAGLMFLAAIFLAQALISLPFDIHDTFGIEARFGFNRTTPKTFIIDRLKGLLLAALIGLPLAALVLWIFHSFPNAWLWAWLAVTAIQLLLTWLAPTFIMPLFNKFTPMADGPLKDDIEALGKQCGFPLDGVFVMDGSKRSSKANAFFTGLGKRKKIALFDTLIENHSTPELLGVLAHEIGHFKKGHIKQRLVVGILQTAAMFFLLGLATSPTGHFSRMLFDAFGVETISPHVGLVIFGILMEPFGKILSVLANAWSRKHEYEADAYAAQATGDPHPLMAALTRMTSEHLSHPSPAKLRVWLDYSHPPLIDRLRALRAWSPIA